MTFTGEEYAQWVVDNLGVTEVFPLVETHQHLAHVNPTLGLKIGGQNPIDGGKSNPSADAYPMRGDNRAAPFFNGDSLNNNHLYITAAPNSPLTSAFRISEGGFMIFLRLASPSVWNDGVRRQPITLLYDTSNYVTFNHRENVGGLRRWQRRAQGVFETIEDGGTIPAPTDWFAVGASWKTGGMFKAFFNGAKFGEVAVNQPGDDMNKPLTLVVGRDMYHKNWFKGWEAYLLLWGAEPTETAMQQAYAARLSY